MLVFFRDNVSNKLELHELQMYVQLSMDRRSQ